jgi:2-phosphosulfolactate phosphatase
MRGSVVIDCFPESAERYRSRCAIVAIDVIRATTTATTALQLGRQVYPAKTTDEAFVLAEKLDNPLLVGELGGNMPDGFDITNSPAQIARRTDTDRPMVLVSSSGTQLLMDSAGSEAVYAACLRNYEAVARHLASRHRHIAVLGAGTRGQFRCEDQAVCALVAHRLVESGYVPENQQTAEWIERWRLLSFASITEHIQAGRSADYLRRSGQDEDLAFVVQHINDLEIVPQLIGRQLVVAENGTPSQEQFQERVSVE